MSSQAEQNGCGAGGARLQAAPTPRLGPMPEEGGAGGLSHLHRGQAADVEGLDVGPEVVLVDGEHGGVALGLGAGRGGEGMVSMAMSH